MRTIESRLGTLKRLQSTYDSLAGPHTIGPLHVEQTSRQGPETVRTIWNGAGPTLTHSSPQ
jgi:hypothetical protein